MNMDRKTTAGPWVAAVSHRPTTKARAEWRARQAYKRSIGAQFRPYAVHGYEGDDRVSVETHGTVVVRVLPGADDSGDICRNADGERGSSWTDSYYPVEIVEDPNDLLKAIVALEVDGPTFQYKARAALAKVKP